MFCKQIYVSTLFFFFFNAVSSEISEVLGKFESQPKKETEALSSDLSGLF